MFHSAAVKLTLWYLGIIMVLSIGCSLALYHVSSNDLQRNARRQVGYFGGLFGPGNANDFATLRQRQLDEDMRHLKANLVFFNFLVLLGGGAASYGLARRTLSPIENALESQTRFTADASHELRTPLTAMQAENEVALRNPNLSKSQAIGQLKSNLEEIEKLKALSDGLLALAATPDPSMDLDTPVSVKQICQNALGRVQKTAELKNITLTNNVIKDMKVKGSQQSLTDLVSILLDNAIKYSLPGGRVILDSSIKDHKVLISVTDSGKGIKQSDLPHIFDRFYRADDSRNKDSVNGYGLGLAIAKKIADTHSGYIEVKSAPRKGSTFTLHLESDKNKT